MNDYLFEEYNDARETRVWFEIFLREHNGKDWQRTSQFSLTDFVTDNFPKVANGESVRTSWYRIKYRGSLVGYASARCQPCLNGRKVVSEMWIIPKYRRQGHFHASFPGVIEYTNAVGICIMMSRYRKYGDWFESFGFNWLFGFGEVSPSGDHKTYLVTRHAFKDMVRFVEKYAGGFSGFETERGRLLVDKVRRELRGNET